MSSPPNPALGISLLRRRSFWVIIGLAAVLGVVQIRMNQAQAQLQERDIQHNARIAQQIQSRQIHTAQLADTLYDRVTTPRVVHETVVEPRNPGLITTQSRAVVGEKYFPRARQQSDTLSPQIRELIQKLRGQPEDKRSPELKEELEKLIKQQFELRHQSQQERLDKILANAKVTELALKRREEQKDEIISRRLLELLGASDPLNWDYQPVGSSYAPTSQRPAPPNAFGPGRPAAPPQASYGYYFDGVPGVPQSPSPGQQPSAFTPTGPPAGLPGLAQSAQQPARPGLPPTADNRWTESPPGQFSAQTTAQPRPNQTGLTDEFLANVPKSLFASTGDTVNAKEIISSGYQVKKGLLELARVRKLVERGAFGESGLAELENSVSEAQTIWDFQKRELKSRIEVAHIELATAEEKLESLNRLTYGSREIENETYEARKELMVAESETRSLVELLSWMESFEKSFQVESDEEGQANQSEAEQDEEASIEGSDSEVATEAAELENEADPFGR